MNRLISTSQREYEDYYEKKKKEAQRYVIEINDLIKRRRKMEEDMEERENQAKTREAILL